MASSCWNNQKVEKVIDKSLLNKMALRSVLLQASFNYERMQSAGWLYSILPGLKKIHKDKNDLSKSMTSHMEFFNTHPFLVTLIMGVIISMEEAKEDVDTIRGIRVGMMGPLGGIGDALFWLTALPISAAIGVSFSLQGNILGPIVFLVIFNLIHFGLRFGLMHYGYKLGIRSISLLKENTKLITRTTTVIGLIVVGALIASYIGMSVQWVPVVGDTPIEIQTVLDSILPKLLPMLYTWFVYYFIKVKNKSPLFMVFVTLLVGLIFVGLPMLLFGFRIL